VLAGILLVKSAKMARYMNEHVWGIRVPDAVIARFEQAGDKRAECVAVAAELIRAVRDLAESLITLSTEHGYQQWLAFGRVFDGWVQAQRAPGDAPVAQLRRAIDEYRATGNELYVPYFIWLIATTQLRYGEPAAGLDTVVAALGMTDATGTRLWDPELYRLKGELLLARDPGAGRDADAAFRHAIETARRQSTKSWELRAVTSLARLLGRNGKRAEARQALAEVYGWFTEGFDTADLTAARILLGELTR